MYDIAADYISGINGLGDGDTNKGSGYDFNNLTTQLIQAGTSIATTAINANNQPSTNNQNGGNYAGGDPATQSPNGNTRTLYDNNYNNNNNYNNSKKDTDWMPWVIGGVAAFALLAVLMMSNGKSKR